MSDDKNNPLEPLEKAHEEVWFLRKNQQLIEQMRQRLSTEERANLIKQASGVSDDHIATALAQLGVTAETAPVLHLVPLLQVAWADDEIEPDERDLLLEAAEATGITEGPARVYFESLLVNKPSAEFFATALDFVAALMRALPEVEANRARNNLEDFALRVAKANGGLFGLFWTVDEDEKAALRQIAQKLSLGKPGATSRMLSKI